MSDDIDDPDLKARIAARNEQRKLDATFLNNTGIGLFLAGVVAPALAYFYDLSTKPGVSPGAVISGAVFWAAIAGLLNQRCLVTGGWRRSDEPARSGLRHRAAWPCARDRVLHRLDGEP